MNVDETKAKLAEIFFDATDAKRTINVLGLRHFKRVHGGTDNEDTLGDLMDSLVDGITNLEEALKGGE